MAERFSISVAARATARGSPARILRDKSVICANDLRSFALQELARDHQALDLTGALADGAQLHVPIELFDRVVLDESVATMDLHGFVRGAHRNLGSRQLRHGPFLADALPAILHPTRAIGEQARGVDLGSHVRQLVLDGLKLRNGTAEPLALLRVFQGRFIRALRGSHRKRRDGEAPAIQNPEAVHESLTLFAEQLRFRHPAICEDDLASSAGAHAELVFLLAVLKTRYALLKNERGNSVLRCGPFGNRHRDADAGVTGVGSEHLAPV